MDKHGIKFENDEKCIEFIGMASGHVINKNMKI